MARRIKRDLPKLTKVLNEKLKEWKASNGEDFLYHGEIYTEVMTQQDEEWTKYKKNEMQIKLKKKQDHQILEENRHLGKSMPAKKKHHTRPLGESSRINTKSTRSRNIGDKEKPLLGTARSIIRSRTYAS